MSNPFDITITISSHLIKDFLGIFAIDVLHDAKGHGYLVDNKLSRLTDLMAVSVLAHNQTITLSEKEIKLYIFKQVLEFFVDVWSTKLDALGVTDRPNFNSSCEKYWDTLYKNVRLPIRKVADRNTEDTFVTLGSTQEYSSIETHCYFTQKEMLTRDYAEVLAFVSPRVEYTPRDFFHQAVGIVDIIQNRCPIPSKVVLDMKASAGLLRTIIDPIGYISGLPTYADPGYNMPGMSAIRQHAILAFIDNDNPTGTYTQQVHEFKYCVNLHIPQLQCDPLVFVSVHYFYGIEKDGLDRNNLSINILDHIFKNTLPHSATMAELLGRYLSPKSNKIRMTIVDTFSHLQSMIWDYFSSLCTPLNSMQELGNIYRELHRGATYEHSLATLLKRYSLSSSLIHWCKDSVKRISYILSTIRNCRYFPEVMSILPLDQEEFTLPETMITSILPNLLLQCTEDSQNISILGFCFYQYQLLKQYIGSSEGELSEILHAQWLPGRKGKLTTQITKLVHELDRVDLCKHEIYIRQFLCQLIQICAMNLELLANYDMMDDADRRIDTFLRSLPVFEPPDELKKLLTERLQFYHPEIYHQTINMDRNGLLLHVLLSAPNELLRYIPQTEVIGDTVNSPESIYSDMMEALYMMLGKFSGDFGQILWCICYGHLFASEDNNASAMAAFLHRLPTDHIVRKHSGDRRWGNLHGLGDGSAVDIILDKN